MSVTWEIMDAMRCAFSIALMLSGLCGSIIAADADSATPASATSAADQPTDVPDPVGLGERLALIDWLHSKSIPVPDNASLADLRTLYRQAQVPVGDDAAERDALTRRLWVDFHQTPATGASVADLRAQVAAEEAAQKQQDDLEKRQEMADAATPTPPVSRDPGDETDPKNPRSAPREKPATTAVLAVGSTFPPFSGTGVDGRPFNFKDWQGRVVLVVFTDEGSDTWLNDIPHIRQDYATYHDRGFEVVTVDFDRGRERLANFADVQRIRWPVLCNPKTGLHELIKPYHVTAMPTYYLVARDGRIAATDAVGDTLDAAVQAALTP
jgi:peroxiredoxin